MTASWRAVLALGLAWWVAGCGGGGSASDDPLPLQIGNRWDRAVTYLPGGASAYSLQVVAASTGAGVSTYTWQYSDRAPATQVLERTATGVRLFPASDAQAMEQAIGPRLLLKLPLQAGSRWVEVDTTIDSDDNDGDGIDDRLAVRAESGVGAVEDVTTPAGTFRNVFVVYTTWTYTTIPSGAGSVPVTSYRSATTWYAPGVGVVQSEALQGPAAPGWGYHGSFEQLTGYRLQ